MFESSRFWSVKDIAKLFSVSQRTIHYWIGRGILRPVRIGRVLRFDPRDIELLVQETKLAPGGTVPREEKFVKRILVVDDDPLVLDSLKRFLEREGYRVEAVPGGEEALRRIEGGNFDLLICDVRMPRVNGVATLRAIREKERETGRSPLPAVMITAYDDPEPREELMELGVSEYLQKPLNLRGFLESIGKSLPVN
jgi:CheY-like chemotaxis protein/predicted DNA-binding transcriptional regulator AlpA